MPTQTAGMGKWVCCTKLPLPKHLSNIINAHSDCTVFTVVCFCSHKLWKQYTKVSWVWFRLIISSHWCCFHNLQLQSWTVKQTTLYSLSERGSSTIVHCVEWYKLVLRTRLPTPVHMVCVQRMQRDGNAVDESAFTSRDDASHHAEDGLSGDWMAVKHCPWSTRNGTDVSRTIWEARRTACISMARKALADGTTFRVRMQTAFSANGFSK